MYKRAAEDRTNNRPTMSISSGPNAINPTSRILFKTQFLRLEAQMKSLKYTCFQVFLLRHGIRSRMQYVMWRQLLESQWELIHHLNSLSPIDIETNLILPILLFYYISSHLYCGKWNIKVAYTTITTTPATQPTSTQPSQRKSQRKSQSQSSRWNPHPHLKR